EGLPRFHIPETNGVILARRKEMPPVREKRDLVDHIRVSDENLQCLPALNVPKLERPVVAGRDGAFGVLGQGDPVDRPFVTWEELPNHLPGRGFTQERLSSGVAQQESIAVGREGNIENGHLEGDFTHGFACRDPPETHLPVPTSGRRQLPVRREAYARNG